METIKNSLGEANYPIIQRRFRIVAQKLARYLERNSIIDIMMHKIGTPGFAGCLEHISMIWHLIQAVKIKM